MTFKNPDMESTNITRSSRNFLTPSYYAAGDWFSVIYIEAAQQISTEEVLGVRVTAVKIKADTYQIMDKQYRL